jgi:hypothetical protein
VATVSSHHLQTIYADGTVLALDLSVETLGGQSHVCVDPLRDLVQTRPQGDRPLHQIPRFDTGGRDLVVPSAPGPLTLGLVISSGAGW